MLAMVFNFVCQPQTNRQMSFKRLLTLASRHLNLESEQTHVSVHKAKKKKSADNRFFFRVGFFGSDIPFLSPFSTYHSGAHDGLCDNKDCPVPPRLALLPALRPGLPSAR